MSATGHCMPQRSLEYPSMLDVLNVLPYVQSSQKMLIYCRNVFLYHVPNTNTDK